MESAGSYDEATNRRGPRDEHVGIGEARSGPHHLGQHDHATPSEALAGWTAVVQGRWHLVEVLDAGDRRHIVAEERAPRTGRVRTPQLSPLQLEALALLARGVAQKVIAYELGISAARVSRLLVNARRELGITSRAELVRVARAALGDSNAPLARWRRGDEP